MAEVLIWLCLGVGLLALVGHGLWMLGAAAIHVLFGANSLPQRPLAGASSRTHCPICDSTLTAGMCAICGWPTPQNRQTDAVAALSAIERQLRRYTELGVLDPATFDRLHSLVESEIAATTLAEAQIAAKKAIPLAPVGVQPVFEPIELVVETPGGQAASGSSATETFSAIIPPVPARPIGERAAAFAARRTSEDASPLRELVESNPTAPPAKRKQRSLSDLLAAFMQEKNIRWGELVGGLLIVCCSIALVISFWAKIAERPFLKFFVFNGVTAALFGVGLYTHYRWRLRNTSDGLLIIGTLLVPLNFLAIAAFTQIPTAGEVLTIAGELLSIALFAGLVFSAGRVIVPSSAWLLTAGVLLPSVLQLLVRRFITPDSAIGMLLAFALAPILLQAIVTLWAVGAAERRKQWDEPALSALLKLAGLAGFATLLPLGLLLVKSGDWRSTLHELAFMVTLIAFAPLTVGLTIWKRATAPSLVAWRTTGTAVALAGAAMLIAAIALAWPQYVSLLSTTAVVAGLLISLGFVYGLPVLHLPAVICAAFAFLLLFHLNIGDFSPSEIAAADMRRLLVSGSSGVALAAPSILAAIAGLLLKRFRRTEDGLCFLASGAIVAAASIGLASWFGAGVVGDPLHVTWLYAAYGLLVIFAADRVANRAVAAFALVLLAAACLQGVVFDLAARVEIALPWAAALLSYGIACAIAALAIQRWTTPSHAATFFDSLLVGGVAASIASCGLLLWSTATNLPSNVWPYWLVLAVVWLLCSLVARSVGLFLAFQTSLYLGVALAVGARLEHYDWFIEQPLGWLDPRSIQAVAIVLSLLSLVLIGLRMLATRAAAHNETVAALRLVDLCRRDRPSVDSAAAALSLAALLAVAAYAAMPGVAQELSPKLTGVATTALSGEVTTTAEATVIDFGEIGATESAERIVPPIEQFEIAKIPHASAKQWGTPALMLVLAIVLVAQWFEGRTSWSGLALLAVAAAAAPLVASQWEADVAVASALRWTSAIYLALGSLLIWCRGPIARWLMRSKWLPQERLIALHYEPQSAIAATFAFSLAPLFLMAGFVGIAAVQRSRAELPALAAMPLLGVAFVMAGAIALTLRFVSTAIVVHESTGTRRAHVGSRSTGWPNQASTLVLILGAAPVIAVSLFVVATALRHSPVLGPNPDSIFARMGLATSYAAPVLITAASLVGFALREKSSRFSFAGGLVLCLGVTAAYLLAIAKTGVAFDFLQWSRLGQLNAIVASLYALAWIGTLIWAGRRSGARPKVNDLLITQVALPVALNAIILLAAWAWLVWRPGALASLSLLGGAWSWTAAGLAAAAVGAASLQSNQRLRVGQLFACLFALAVLIALTAASRDTGNWLAFHVLLIAHWGIAYLLLATGLIVEQFRPGCIRYFSARPGAVESEISVQSPIQSNAAQSRATTMWRSLISRWTLVALSIAISVALRALLGDPQTPWWTFGVATAMTPVVVAVACWALRPGLLYVGAALIHLAATIAFVELRGIASLEQFIELLYFNVAALALPTPIWMALYRRVFRPQLPAATGRHTPMHRAAAMIALAGLLLLVGYGLWMDVQSNPLAISPAFVWLALVATAVAVGSLLWDEGVKDSVLALYVLGLATVALSLDQLDLTPRWLLWNAALALAAYTLLTSYLWSRRRGLAMAARRLGITTSDEDFAGLQWLVPANLAAVCVVIVSAVLIQFSFPEFSLRLAVAKAAAVQALSIGLIARGTRRTPLQFVALLVGVIGAVTIGGASLDPSTTGTLLNRAVVLLAAVAVMAIVYGFGTSKFLSEENEWSRAALRLVPALMGTCGLVLALILVVEVSEYARFGEVAVSWPAILVVALTLLGLALAALMAAVLPGRDPFQLSERGRQTYVYGAEVILGLLFLHVRLTMPWLFHGFFQQYWPLVVMLIAFVGAGLGEVLRRRNVVVVGEPLEHTGALLPLLPVLGYWALPTKVDYGLLLLSVAALYAALSAARRSFVLALVSILAANGALWHFLHHQEGYRLLEHPQLWLIPPALSVLVAAYVNRRQLPAAQLTAIRYASSTVIYVSSTADIFINGVAQNPWLPLVLAGLSLLGIFAGILLQVRAFLFLGTSFLLLALLTIIWYAAVDLQQTWLWAASGVVTGVLIIALFAVFEKKRQEVLEMLDRLKQWEA